MGSARLGNAFKKIRLRTAYKLDELCETGGGNINVNL